MCTTEHLREELSACAGGLQTWNPSCWLSSAARHFTIRNLKVCSLCPSQGNAKFGVPESFCSSSTVKHTISKLLSAQATIDVKRKFKVDGNKTIKWWHVISGSEETMTLIEQEWSKVKTMTSWSIKPCLSYLDSTQALGNQSPDAGNHPIVNNNTTEIKQVAEASGSSTNDVEHSTSQQSFLEKQ